MKSLLKKAGYKFSKKQWPKLDRFQLEAAGITPEMVAKETHAATIHETMGPHWKEGIFVCGRPRAFNF